MPKLERLRDELALQKQLFFAFAAAGVVLGVLGGEDSGLNNMRSLTAFLSQLKRSQSLRRVTIRLLRSFNLKQTTASSSAYIQS